MNLPQPVAVGIWVVLGVVLLTLVLVGRRRLVRRSAGVVPTPPAVPAESARGAVVLGPLDALYVSSTLSGDWLARVGAHGLGDRSQAQVTVHDGGLYVARSGAPDVWVPAAAVGGAALTPGMAGKFVGKEAIVVVTWTVPAEPVPADAPEAPANPEVRLDTGLLPRHDHDVARLLDAVQGLAGRAAADRGGPADDGSYERRPGAPSGAAPADPAGPAPTRESATPGTDENDEEAP
ncbi:PH-like domain-containing protein [Cellulosimicrobium protaetiae]